VLRRSPATASCTHLVQENKFPELNRHILTFWQLMFFVWSHILSTIGDALSTFANSTLIILFSEMLKFSKMISSESKNIVKEMVNI
jgi:hypothetical protein